MNASRVSSFVFEYSFRRNRFRIELEGNVRHCSRCSKQRKLQKMSEKAEDFTDHVIRQIVGWGKSAKISKQNAQTSKNFQKISNPTWSFNCTFNISKSLFNFEFKAIFFERCFSLKQNLQHFKLKFSFNLSF